MTKRPQKTNCSRWKPERSIQPCFPIVNISGSGSGFPSLSGALGGTPLSKARSGSFIPTSGVLVVSASALPLAPETHLSVSTRDALSTVILEFSFMTDGWGWLRSILLIPLVCGQTNRIIQRGKSLLSRTARILTTRIGDTTFHMESRFAGQNHFPCGKSFSPGWA